MSGDGGIADPGLVKQTQARRQPPDGGTIWYALMLYLNRTYNNLSISRPRCHNVATSIS